ncbi:MAG: DUF2721 domain-containing protein [Gammaproteobacteria bacterium]|jgi:hypothetical protein|nr:DUF2721 domain-containing protein [Gammaproteobacteria bacterium]
MDAPISGIAHSIQLAVAPVFLLAGIGGLLGVLTNRIGRIIDRSRNLRDQIPSSTEARGAELRDELGLLARRARLVNSAIALCTASALLVCLVVAVLFLGSFITHSMATPIALLFIGAMLCLIAALLLLMREILLSTARLRIGV